MSQSIIDVAKSPLFMQWNDTYSVGINNIDNQHMRIMTIMNDLFASLQLGAAEEEIMALLSELIAFAHVHHVFEERLLRTLGYPHLCEHTKQHEDLRQKIRELKRSLSSDHEPERFLTFMKQWWHRHILEEDMKYAQFVLEAIQDQ